VGAAHWTPRSGPPNVESDRLDRQRALLENARDLAAAMDATLRTSAMVAGDAGEALVDVASEERADRILVGWQGRSERADCALGSTLDTVVSEAPCDASLIRVRNDAVGRPIALAGAGPHAPVAARRAADFVTVSDSVATLLNVQRRTPAADGDPDRVERGRETIESVARRGGLESEEYETVVVVATDVESAILQTIREYDTVCVGLSERSALSRTTFGSLAELVSRELSGNVGLVRRAGASESPPDGDNG